jgi:hypothetical protein
MRTELERLRERGARAFDEPAYRFIEALLKRAEALGGEAGAHLSARASDRMTDLRESFETARERTEQDLAQLRELGDEPNSTMKAELEAGRLEAAHRRVRRRIERLRAHRRRTRGEIIERIAEKARTRGLTPPPPAPDLPLLTAGAPRPAPEEVFRLSELLYKQAFETSSARHAVANALDGLPKVAGRYHATTIAARTLAEMEGLSFPYLAAQLRRLSLYGALRAFAAPRESTPRKKARKN